MQEHENRAEIIDGLVKLIEKLTPFLDCSGRAFCSMPHTDETKRGILPLRDRQVHALLAYQFRGEHEIYAGRDRVNEAIDYVEGKLLASRKGPIVAKDCPVLRCFLHAIEENDGGTGSAEDILKMLREVRTKRKLTKGAEKLPNNPTAMGKWLVKNQLILQAHGIEVFRPPRGSKKRLWDWRKIIRDDDTSDTSTTEVSQGASLPKPGDNNENRNDDTSDEAIDRMLKENQS
ncbi:MAG TPA: hypothetical protein VN688_08505 [Gemmataceae bacterium]|nr:hypothetical protein [Gemmataceae bacterium]